MNKNVPSAEYFKEFLLKIYRCKEPFELLVSDRKTKSRMGSYASAKRRINIYSKWISECPLEEIAIHEYAHHIQHTEKGGIFGRGRERSHGEFFWRIYSALMAKAIEKGLFSNKLIDSIIIQN